MSARQIHKSSACWLAVLLAFALMASACGGGDDGGEAQPSQAVETTETADAAEPVDSGDGDDGEEAPASGDTEPETVQEQELLAAPVDTTTTTTPPAPSEGGEAAPEAPAEPEPQSGGTLRIGVEAEGDSLNPSAGSFAVSAYIMTYPLFDPLAYFDTQGDWIPYLAESFTKIGDGTQWQMKLREGVRFHDGTELDADDVIATFNAQLADLEISLALRPNFDPESPVVKIDKYTVQYKAVRPSARFPATLASQLGMILPSEWLERVKEDPTLNQMPVGQGPFKIESRVQDEKTVLVPNPDYWAADRIDIYLDRIEVTPITDMAVAAERLAAGDLDMVVTTNAEATLTLREAAEQGEIPRPIENVRSSESFAVINSQAPPFDDIRARQALTFASDRDRYVLFIRQGTTPPADTMFHPRLIWHNPDVKQETNMPERAGPLAAAYCADNPGDYEWPPGSGSRLAYCTDGKINMRLLFSGPSNENRRVADLQTDAWEDFFNVEQVEKLQDAFIFDVVLGFYNVANWRQFGEIEPDNDILWLQCDTDGALNRTVPGIALNFPRYCDEERDALMFESRRIDDRDGIDDGDDRDQRITIWQKVQEMIRDAYTYIFYNHSNWVIGYRDNVHNICGQTSPDGFDVFCNNQGRAHLSQIWLG